MKNPHKFFTFTFSRFIQHQKFNLIPQRLFSLENILFTGNSRGIELTAKIQLTNIMICFEDDKNEFG